MEQVKNNQRSYLFCIYAIVTLLWCIKAFNKHFVGISCILLIAFIFFVALAYHYYQEAQNNSKSKSDLNELIDDISSDGTFDSKIQLSDSDRNQARLYLDDSLEATSKMTDEQILAKLKEKNKI